MSVSGKKSTISAKALKALFDKGVGRGSGAEYLPWLHTSNTNSIGRSGKYDCPLTDRRRDFLSDGEERLVYSALRDLQVTDARENYPLAIGLTAQIAAALGIAHISSTGPGKPLTPYTTDLLLTRKTPPIYVALSWRERSALAHPEQNNSLLVEYVYWTLHEIPFLCATELEVSKNAKISLEALRLEVHHVQSDLRKQPTVDAYWRAARKADWSAPAREVSAAISKEVKVDSKRGLRILYDLI